MHTNKQTSHQEGSSDSFKVEYQSIKSQHRCTRCTESFPFAFQLRRHLRFHLLKLPSAYVHDMKSSLNLPSHFGLVKEESIVKDDADLCWSNQESLPSKENNRGVDEDQHICPCESGMVRPKSEYSILNLPDVQSMKRKRTSSQTLAKICDRLKKSKSLSNLHGSGSSTASTPLALGAEQAADENPLDGNDCKNLALQCSQDASQNESHTESYSAKRTTENVIHEKENVDVSAPGHQNDSSILSKDTKTTDTIISHNDALAFDRQEHSVDMESAIGVDGKISRSYVENTSQKTWTSIASFQDKRNSEDVVKTVQQKQVTLGDVDSAEEVIPLTDSYQLDSCVQKGENLQEPLAKGFICSLCGSSYSKNAGLSLHLLAHKRREMIVKFKKKEETKQAKTKCDVLPKTSNEATCSTTVSDSECLTSEWVVRETESTSMKKSLNSDMSEEKSIRNAVLKENPATKSSSVSNVLNSTLSKCSAANRVCNPKDSDMESSNLESIYDLADSEYSTAKSMDISKDLKGECITKQRVCAPAYSETEYLTVNRANETHRLGSTNVFYYQCSSASIGSKVSTNSTANYFKTMHVNAEEDLMEEPTVAQCPETCNDLTHDHCKMLKTGDSLDKQVKPGIEKTMVEKLNKTVKSCYKNKLELIACQYCHKLVSKRNMARHRSIHCPVLTLPCPTKCHICAMTLESGQLIGHLEDVHGQGVMRMRSCNVCFKTGFHSFAILQEHKKEHFLNIKDIDLRPEETHDGSLPGCGSMCPICNSEALTASNIRAHIVGHMVDKECNRKQLRKGQKFECPVCLRSFELNSRIENHVLSHWRIRLYECPACKLPFTRYDALERHCAKKHKANATNDLSSTQKSSGLQHHKTEIESQMPDDQSNV